ncbi:MAG TPA: hypothetical protein PLC79_00195 [Phycisphaerae bacterium]|nr:hypothetical protein [Phycisphaerae bacterium]
MKPILLACSPLLWASVALAYEPPVYPQTPPVLLAIEPTAPATARAGATLELAFTLTLSGDLERPAPLFAHLRRDGRVYHVATFTLLDTGKPRDGRAGDRLAAGTATTGGPHPRTLRAGEPIRLGPFSTPLPDDLPAGEYEIVAGMYGQPRTGRTTLTIDAPAPRHPPIIISTGTFTDKHGVPHRWHINAAHTLFWDGEPWFPVGGMFIPDNDWDTIKAQLDLLRRYGIRDIYFNVGNGMMTPHTWETKSEEQLRYFQRVIDYMDEIGMRYGVQTSGLEARGYAYDLMSGPDAEVLVDNDGNVTMAAKADDKVIEGGDLLVYRRNVRDAFYLVADTQTGGVAAWGQASIEHDERPGEQGRRPDDHKAVRVPLRGLPTGRLRVSLCLAERRDGWNQNMYYWGGQFDAYAAKMRELYTRVRMGPGFRFAVDLFWNENNLQHGFVPSDPDYRDQYARQLREKYSTLDALRRAWAPDDPNAIESFEQAARLLPLRAIDDAKTKVTWACLIDPQSKKLVRCRFAVSQFRYDLVEAIGQQVRDFHNRIADVFKEMNDVPVIFKCFSGLDWWHINDACGVRPLQRPPAVSERPHSRASRGGETPGFDGLGMESYGVGEPMLTFMGIPAFGECEQATRTMWLVVTETGEGNHQDACPSRNKLMGYTSRLGTMYANYTSLISGGAKGIFQYYLMPGRGEDAFWSDAVSRDPRQLEWLGTYARILANAPKLADYSPRVYYRFPGIFNPNGGLTFSDPYRDYFNTDTLWFVDPAGKLADGTWVLPTFSLRPKTDMYLINIENTPASLRYANDVEAAIKSGQRITWIGYRKDRGTIPSVDRYYTAEFAKDEDGVEFQVLTPPPSAKVIARNNAGQVWNLIDGKLQIISKNVDTGVGWRPERVDLPPGRHVFDYRGFMRQVLGAAILDTADPALEAFSYRDGDESVTVVSLAPGYGSLVRLGKELPPYTLDATGNVLPPPKEGFSRTVTLDRATTSAAYADGERIEPAPNGVRSAVLRPADLTLVKRSDRHRWAPEGILFDTIHAHDTVIVRSRTPATAGGVFEPRLFAPAVVAPESSKPGSETPAVSAGSGTPPAFVWIEAESAIESNFNLNVFGGLAGLSGDAMLGLGTAVPPPQPDGYFAKLAFEAPTAGEYQLWIREGYLATASPSRWRIDDGAWHDAPNTLVPRDIRLVAQYNAIDDERMIFAWYHYAAVKLTAGRHTLLYGVASPRPKGQQVGLAEARPYAKLLDCVALAQGAFAPNGKERTVATGAAGEPVLINLLVNPSLEYQSGGWTAAQQEGDTWKPAELSVERGWEKDFWWTYRADNEGRIRLEGLMDIGGLRVRQSFAGVRSLRIRAGGAARRISSTPANVSAARAYVFGGYLRTDGLGRASATLRLRFLGEKGETIGEQDSPGVTGSSHWTFVAAGPVRPPPGAKSAAIDCVVTPDKAGMAWFDDMYLAAE